MYALHDAGLAVSALPPPGTVDLPAGQVEPRAVEPTEHGTLDAPDERKATHTSGSPVLNLVWDFAESFTEMVASANELGVEATASGAYLGESVGQGLDVYA